MTRASGAPTPKSDAEGETGRRRCRVPAQWDGPVAKNRKRERCKREDEGESGKGGGGREVPSGVRIVVNEYESRVGIGWGRVHSPTLRLGQVQQWWWKARREAGCRSAGAGAGGAAQGNPLQSLRGLERLGLPSLSPGRGAGNVGCAPRWP